MLNVKPLINISDSFADCGKKLLCRKYLTQLLPVKSYFQGLKLAVLEKDSLNLTVLEGKKIHPSQAERLKEFYNSKGIRYLLPHEEWSDVKIFNAINSLNNELNKIITSKPVNKKNIQKAVNVVLSEAKGKIVIKDFTDLEKDLKAEAFDDDIIKYYLQVGAVTLINLRSSRLYFRLKKSNLDKVQQLFLIEDIGHEVKHALTTEFKNIQSTNMYKNNHYKTIDLNPTYNNIFSKFESYYHKDLKFEQTILNDKNFLKAFGFNSIGDLHKDFDEKIKTLIYEIGLPMEIGVDKKAWKQFYNYLRAFAKDEKESRFNIKIYRSIFKNSKKPTSFEFKIRIYEEMEKFFEQKRLEANKIF